MQVHATCVGGPVLRMTRSAQEGLAHQLRYKSLQLTLETSVKERLTAIFEVMLDAQ